MPAIDPYFQYLIQAGASDLHLSEGQPPKIRAHGALQPISEGILEHESLKGMLAEICDPRAFENYLESGDLDFA